MFEFRLYLYDLNFNDLNQSIDLFPTLLNEDISLTIERERGVFEKTNSDLSLNFSNLVKLSNGQTILKYLKDNITSKKFRIKVLSNNKIVFDGYVENESISYDVENETLSLNVFAIEKEFWKRCENILFSEFNYTNDSILNNTLIDLGSLMSELNAIILDKEFFEDILNSIVINGDSVLLGQEISLRNNTLKTGFYWLDRDKFSLKEFFEAIIKIYNLEFKIDYNLKQGIFRERLVVNNSSAIDISKDVIKSGITFSPQIEKFDLIKVNEVADINNEELFSISENTFAIDTGAFHGGGITGNNNPTLDFWYAFIDLHNIDIDSLFDLYWNNEGIINYANDTLKLYFYFTNSQGKTFISEKPIIERVVPSDTDDAQMQVFTIPTINDFPNVLSRKIVISGGTIAVKWWDIISWRRATFYTTYSFELDNVSPFKFSSTQNPDGTLRFSINHFLDTTSRDAFVFGSGSYEIIKDSSYFDETFNRITDETQIKRSNIFELENEIKLKFHEDKNNDGTLNTDEDKPKEATRNQIQKMFNLGGKFYQDLISSFKNILKSTSKIECEVNRDDLRIGDKVKINLTSDIDGEYVINKNEIDLINGISKIEALSEVI